MQDPTESTRRRMVTEINSNPSKRQLLEEKYGEVYTLEELDKEFKIIGFMAPYIAVDRLSDDKRGTMMFQDRPRFYYNFKESLI